MSLASAFVSAFESARPDERMWACTSTYASCDGEDVYFDDLMLDNEDLGMFLHIVLDRLSRQSGYVAQVYAFRVAAGCVMCQLAEADAAHIFIP